MISMRMLILSYMIQEVVPHVYKKFQNPKCSSSSEIFYKKNFIGEKDKWTNKGNDKHEEADSLTQYNESYPMFEQNFNILGEVVLRNA